MSEGEAMMAVIVVGVLVAPVEFVLAAALVVVLVSALLEPPVGP